MGGKERVKANSPVTQGRWHWKTGQGWSLPARCVSSQASVSLGVKWWGSVVRRGLGAMPYEAAASTSWFQTTWADVQVPCLVHRRPSNYHPHWVTCASERGAITYYIITVGEQGKSGLCRAGCFVWSRQSNFSSKQALSLGFLKGDHIEKALIEFFFSSDKRWVWRNKCLYL